MQEKKLTLAARNRLLAEMTGEVEALVLNDNYRQNQAISLMERMSVARLGSSSTSSARSSRRACSTGSSNSCLRMRNFPSARRVARA